MSKVIIVKVLPHTDTKPTRYKASDCDGNNVISSKSFVDAAKLFCEVYRFGGKWIGAQATQKTWAFIRTDVKTNYSFKVGVN